MPSSTRAKTNKENKNTQEQEEERKKGSRPQRRINFRSKEVVFHAIGSRGKKRKIKWQRRLK